MFGLPIVTAAILMGVIGFWIVYTAAFYVISRNWAVEDVDYDPTEEAP